MELNLDNCRATNIEGLTDDFTNLESLSLINVGLTTLKGFPKLPNLRKVSYCEVLAGPFCFYGNMLTCWHSVHIFIGMFSVPQLLCDKLNDGSLIFQSLDKKLHHLQTTLLFRRHFLLIFVWFVKLRFLTFSPVSTCYLVVECNFIAWVERQQVVHWIGCSERLSEPDEPQSQRKQDQGSRDAWTTGKIQ